MDFRIEKDTMGEVKVPVNAYFGAQTQRSIDNFKIYIESKFEIGMNWENWGHGADKWNLDHIVPCAIFDLSKLEHQKRCFHFSNYQPLWQIENFKKKAKTTGQLNLI